MTDIGLRRTSVKRSLDSQDFCKCKKKNLLLKKNKFSLICISYNIIHVKLTYDAFNLKKYIQEKFQCLMNNTFIIVIFKLEETRFVK